MGESQHRPPSRLGMRNRVGEIVEVEGGHIVRSTGRKDRHSKVCTAKGPRDRRVRLSAHTAIQFYDVQDRLGYDRPSKAVDWLIKKAKAAIDELEKPPAWNRTTKSSIEQVQILDERDYQLCVESLEAIGGSSGGNSRILEQHQQQPFAEILDNGSNFLHPLLDSDAITDTITSIFPIGAATETTVSSPPIQFQSYTADMLSRTSSQNEDLQLSLRSLQEPIPLQYHHHHHDFAFDGSSAGWSDHCGNQSADINRFRTLVASNAAYGGGTGGSYGQRFIFNTILSQTVSHPPPLVEPSFGQNQVFSQGGALQSSKSPSVRACIDPIYHHHNQISQGFGEISGFRIPARIQGEEEEHDGIHNKPSAAYSESRH